MGREGNHQRNEEHYKERQHESQQPGGETGEQQGQHQRNEEHYKERQHQSQQPGGQTGEQQDQYQQSLEQTGDQQDQSPQSKEQEWSSESHVNKDAPKGEMGNCGNDTGSRGNSSMKENSDFSGNSQSENSGSGDKKDSTSNR